MDHADSKQRFLAECKKMDPLHDAFSKVLERAGVADGDSLKIEELNSLHRLYLEMLSQALRHGIQEKVELEPSQSRHI
ncbi:MAG: hypothetical protein EOP86_09610 [Verrucomicrobiaceae bacterium]|nr:MAG: hypothetical protein EOP86_09610 [Verrucomicrobiaceae bacterium]